MEKLYIVTRRDLPPGPQAVQSCHAALQFAMEHPEMTARWFGDSNYLALLSVPNEEALQRLLAKAKKRGLRYSIFQEPDLGNAVTAIALEPGDLSRRVCSNLPLTLASEAQR